MGCITAFGKGANREVTTINRKFGRMLKTTLSRFYALTVRSAQQNSAASASTWVNTSHVRVRLAADAGN